MTFEANDTSEPSFSAPSDAPDDRRTSPPRVYRAANVDHWIVEPPSDRASPEGKMVFTGARAQHLALTYAHEKFGNARFFPY